MNKRPYRVSFWNRKTISPSGCWEWVGSKRELGYGQVRYKGRSARAHRIAWELTFGEIPDGRSVLHKCDNPPCINPDHLFLGTQQDNVDDMFRKGRQKTPGNGKAKSSASCHPNKPNHSHGLCKICNQRRLRTNAKN